MENSRDYRGPLHIIDPVICQPVECFEEKEHSEQGHKLGTEVIPEDGEGQACLGDSIEETLYQMLRKQWKKIEHLGLPVINARKITHIEQNKLY